MGNEMYNGCNNTFPTYEKVTILKDIPLEYSGSTKRIVQETIPGENLTPPGGNLTIKKGTIGIFKFRYTYDYTEDQFGIEKPDQDWELIEMKSIHRKILSNKKELEKFLYKYLTKKLEYKDIIEESFEIINLEKVCE